MTLLLTEAARERRRIATGGPLAPLARSLLHDLEPLLGVAPDVPQRKALLSSDGGRCPRDGMQLGFDPFSPVEHRCPTCGEAYTGERHERAWITWYQLWLVERAVHAAALRTLVPDERLVALSRSILAGCAERYLQYPNRDNVLGPSRPFFSTYLESIWLLYVCIALDLLETAGVEGSLGATVRERVIAPSAALIADYDEGGSNRQVWNNAALIAAHLVLGNPTEAERAIVGRWGVLTHLATGLLADGSWFEGENYHLFAHRGLWYGVTLAKRAGIPIPVSLARRFDDGWSVPLATALPDFTFPSRRDSQYAISLRQWRFAESCELGLVRTGDRRLIGALHELYARPYPRGDTGRWRSTAESERNEPPTSLTRADLGWRSLLFARAELPPLEPVPARSTLLEWQGFAVFRRRGGDVYAALDYGHSGGGHGHPDRLNVLLAVGRERWLDDVGTGSYVDPSLHWYRSTLAHNAPLVDGRSQQRTHGVLRAYDERGGVGWADAEVRSGGIAPGVRVARSLVVLTDYAIEQLTWDSEREARIELPLHAPIELANVGDWLAATLDGGADPQDGFSFVRDAERATAHADGITRLTIHTHGGGDAWALVPAGSEWWRATAPGPPGSPSRRFHLLRCDDRAGGITIVWSWDGAVIDVAAAGETIVVTRRAGERHTHERRGIEWQIELEAGMARSTIVLSGMHLAPAAEAAPATPVEAAPARPLLVDSTKVAALSFELGEAHYRRSEPTWHDAGRPRAYVTLGVDGDDLAVAIDVRKSPVFFRPASAPDPKLDNEQPDIHSDGAQLYLACPALETMAGWLIVPEEGGGARIRPLGDTPPTVPLAARWRRSTAGYVIEARVPLDALGRPPSIPLALDVVINDMTPDRERRRGQLVMSGAGDERVYLRGDRHDAARLLPFVVARG